MNKSKIKKAALLAFALGAAAAVQPPVASASGCQCSYSVNDWGSDDCTTTYSDCQCDNTCFHAEDTVCPGMFGSTSWYLGGSESHTSSSGSC